MDLADMTPAQRANADQHYARACEVVDELLAVEPEQKATNFETTTAIAVGPLAEHMVKIHDPNRGVFAAMIVAAELLRRLHEPGLVERLDSAFWDHQSGYDGSTDGSVCLKPGCGRDFHDDGGHHHLTRVVLRAMVGTEDD